MMNHWIKLEDHFEPNVLALARQAASASVYTRRYDEWDADWETTEEDAETGPELEPGAGAIWSIVGAVRLYRGLFDERHQELVIEEPAAYSVLETCFSWRHPQRPPELRVNDEQFTVPDEMSSDQLIETFGDQPSQESGQTAEELVCSAEEKVSILRRFGAEALAVAERAAPGSWYTRRYQEWEAEYDDDAGWYVTVSHSYGGLYGRDRVKLDVQDPSAYEDLSDYFQPEDIEYDDTLESDHDFLRVHMDDERFIEEFGQDAEDIVNLQYS